MSGARRLGPALAVLLAGATPGCDTDSYFTLGRDLEICEQNLPTACGPTARCVIDEGNYLSGKFPSARRFIVRTGGEADLLFEFLFFDRRAPGTELRVVFYEPTCGDRSIYDSAGQDVFRLSGEDSILAVPMRAVQPGDHLVEISSDAYTSYSLRVTKK